ncbi:hypothetical protein GPB2148_2628 [marine gamma proteobacterium HTCC2148]|nr:hypothetical protein GPB2148_2628 [marine gamma proteobacterium HTCC2148]
MCDKPVRHYDQTALVTVWAGAAPKRALHQTMQPGAEIPLLKR